MPKKLTDNIKVYHMSKVFARNVECDNVLFSYLQLTYVVSYFSCILHNYSKFIFYISYILHSFLILIEVVNMP